MTCCPGPSARSANERASTSSGESTSRPRCCLVDIGVCPFIGEAKQPGSMMGNPLLKRESLLLGRFFGQSFLERAIPAASVWLRRRDLTSNGLALLRQGDLLG
jgi:hypothetical protein